jgi:hypothetical protein
VVTGKKILKRSLELVRELGWNAIFTRRVQAMASLAVAVEGA